MNWQPCLLPEWTGLPCPSAIGPASWAAVKGNGRVSLAGAGLALVRTQTESIVSIVSKVSRRVLDRMEEKEST